MGDEASLVKLLEASLATGRWDQARDLLRQTPARMDGGDAAGRTSLGRLAEQLGEPDRAILEYNLVLKLEPTNAEALRRLARLRCDRGELERAARAYRRLVQLVPDDVDAALELAGVLENLGHQSEGAAVLEAILARVDDPRAREHLTRLASAEQSFREPESPGTGDAAITPSDADLVTLATQFGGREGVYARQWTSPTGQYGYTPIHEPFTPSVARSHLLGAYTVGIYPVRMDGTVPFLVFDLDASRFALSRDARDGRGTEPLMRLVHGVARRFVDAAARLGIEPLLEDSGWKGRHVWFLFDLPVPATAARRLADLLLADVGPLPPEVTVEVFPKQTRVAQGSLGNLIKLPLGIHRVTGRRSLLIDAEGRPFRDQLEALRRVARTAREKLRQILEHAASPLQVPEPPSGARHPAGDAEPANAPSNKPLQDIYDPEKDLELQWLLQGCAVLAEIVRRARAQGVLSNDERNVLTYTAGHLANGPLAVNHVLSSLLSIDSAAFLKSQLRGNPMSCPRIRSRLPGIAAGVGCNCRFEPDAGLYPNPLLHLHDLRARGDLDRAAPRLTALQVERLVTDLLRTRSEADRMQRLARELERRLLELMEGQGLAELTAAGMRLTRADRDGVLTLSLPSFPAEVVEVDEHSLRDGAGSGGRPEGCADRGPEGTGPPPGPAAA